MCGFTTIISACDCRRLREELNAPFFGFDFAESVAAVATDDGGGDEDEAGDEAEDAVPIREDLSAAHSASISLAACWSPRSLVD